MFWVVIFAEDEKFIQDYMNAVWMNLMKYLIQPIFMPLWSSLGLIIKMYKYSRTVISNDSKPHIYSDLQTLCWILFLLKKFNLIQSFLIWYVITLSRKYVAVICFIIHIFSELLIYVIHFLFMNLHFIVLFLSVLLQAFICQFIFSLLLPPQPPAHLQWSRITALVIKIWYLVFTRT